MKTAQCPYRLFWIEKCNKIKMNGDACLWALKVKLVGRQEQGI